MDKSIQKDFRSPIEERIREIMELIASSEENREAVAPDVAIGRLSRLDSMQMQQIALGAHQQLFEEMSRLKAALERIDKGTYGTCESCGRDIPYGRLEIMPAATACVSCLERFSG